MIKGQSAHFYHRLIRTVAAIAVLGMASGLAGIAVAQSVLPADLFTKQPSGTAIAVGEARKVAQIGKPLVLRGVVGGPAAPFADKLAMFLLADKSLVTCSDGCGKDFCGVPREKIVANVAMIQVVDGAGRPLRTTLKGANGLAVANDVTVEGTVAKVDNNVLIVNARHILVNQPDTTPTGSDRPKPGAARGPIAR